MASYDPSTINLLDPAVRRDPYPYFEYMRREQAVFWFEQLNAFVITRYDDVSSVLKDPGTFSSVAMRRQEPGRDDGKGGNSVITVDPPEHSRLRKILQDEFRVRPLKILEPRVRELVGQLRDRLRQNGTIDLVNDFTIPLPVTVIAELLDIEESRHSDFKHWSDCLIKLLNDREGPEWQCAREGVLELISYFSDTFEERYENYVDRDDILSVLLKAESDGRIDRREMIAYSILLLTGGNETTTNLLGGMIIELVERPHVAEEIQADLTRIPNSIEEGLRYCSPVQGVYRRAMRDVEICGVPIPAQSDVVTLLASANNDENKFPNPRHFDVHRGTGGHAGFGIGIHHCLGAHLGRLEARIGLEVILPELKNLERDYDEIEWNDNWFVRGPEKLPFRWA